MWTNKIKALTRLDLVFTSAQSRRQTLFSHVRSNLWAGSLACVASVSVWFRSKERPRNWPREKWNKSQKWKWGEGEGKVSFLSSPSLPRSFTGAIFALSLTTETLATQAIGSPTARREVVFKNYKKCFIHSTLIHSKICSPATGLPSRKTPK